ncbi:MAG TPA: class II fumarate hydratase, partial [Longimicrobiaceae bacterium]|nr:class II fumarate hydratase [Longimicrobiaceae bacterium]
MSNHSSFRTERDSLGEMRVPTDALYGAQTQRAVENFPISNLRFPRRFIAALGIIKKAAAQTNLEMNQLDRERAVAIIRAADEVIEGMWDDQFVLDIFQTGSGTSSNMNANEVIARRAGQILGKDGPAVHPNDHVNMGQSSNDVIPTAMHVAARVAIHQDLIPSLERLRESLQVKAAEFDDVVKSGRTHLMDATPVRLGQEFGGYAAQLENSVRRLRSASDELAELALGGTAVGTGTNRLPDFPANTIRRIGEATRLEFSEAENHFEAQGGKDAYVFASGALNSLAVALLKIANDIRWLASGPTSGLSEINLPAIQPGSSIMPGKVNPVMSEAMMMICAQVMGNHVAVTIGGQHGNFELNVMMPVMAHNFLESVAILSAGCDAFRTNAVAGITANRERCRELLEKNPSIATALNAHIGYDEASAVAKEAASKKESVREVVKRRGLLSDEQLDEVLNVREMTEPGIPGL